MELQALKRIIDLTEQYKGDYIGPLERFFIDTKFPKLTLFFKLLKDDKAKTDDEMAFLLSFSTAFTSDYKKLKYEELYLAFEYQQKKQEEKEEQKGITAFRIDVTELQGKEKLSQNKSAQERERIGKHLIENTDSTARETGLQMLNKLLITPITDN